MKSIYYISVFLISLIIIGTGCNSSCCKAGKKETDQLIKTDIAFSDMSVKEGNEKAFMHYASDSAILFRQGNYPIIGHDSLLASFKKNSPSNRTLSWKPTKADIATSNDLGYTVGEWLLAIRDSSGITRLFNGHYFTIWKKQKDGKWKFVVDGGTSLK
jgi:ketosteroid isomerase-like protein